MANKMLIDAAHPEETRVVVLRGNRVEEFDFESASKKPLRGNIYLAKVTRVEPSLQAAFIEYGGNRHGFLAFSEIHPDYYQIPVADRQALLDEEARAHREEDDEQRGGNGNGGSGGNGGGRRSRRNRKGSTPTSEKRAHQDDDTISEAIEPTDAGPDDLTNELRGSEDEVPLPDLEEGVEAHDAAAPSVATADEPALPFESDGVASPVPDDVIPLAFEAAPELSAAPVAGEAGETDSALSEDETADHTDSQEFEEAAATDLGDASADRSSEARQAGDEDGSDETEIEDEAVEQIGGDALEDVPFRAPRLRRHYKIQEVIKRRQILLVQVVKEERGNKGAALTTYLSLAGRYSVLMPNTARGGGISRKITDSEDRKRLKAIAHQLDVPEGMGVILRTAGASRSDSEVRRDFEYLLRMWETVRELTLRSSAPMLVYEEGSLIKRAIRDLYSKEIDEICVAGDTAYREAKDYMRLLMPTHAKNVQLYRDSQPIFAKSGVEAQLDAMFSNHVTLKSGGYIVINQTEALVAIDVNSGRSTREHNIEDTALRTNLEAADEVARQLRLRDLAGLIVVDFIDMEEGRNNRSVERRIKDALKNDRARIQIGRISHFGLLEMSRQRIRTGVLEGSTVICPHCAGAGSVRSTSSIALHVLRVLEDTLIRTAEFNLVARTRNEVALYILNQKRAHLMDLELRFGVTVAVLTDPALTGTIYHALERGEPATPPVGYTARTALPEQADVEDVGLEDEDVEDEVTESEAGDDGEPAGRSDDESQTQSADEGGDRKRRRRRRRRGRDRDTRGSSAIQADDEQPSDAGMETMAIAGGDLTIESSDGFEEDGPQAEPATTHVPEAAGTDGMGEVEPAASGAIAQDSPSPEDTPVAEAPRRRRSRRVAAKAAAPTQDLGDADPTAPTDEVAPTPRRSRRSRTRVAEEPTLSFEAPSADRDMGADTAEQQPPESVVEPVAAVESTTAPERASETEISPVPAAPEPVAAAPSEDEPARPKRSGWWQRAKATLTGE